jgi:hypothetical protein
MKNERGVVEQSAGSVRQRRIPCVKIRPAVRIRASALAEWLASREIAVGSGTHRLETELEAE